MFFGVKLLQIVCELKNTPLGTVATRRRQRLKSHDQYSWWSASERQYARRETTENAAVCLSYTEPCHRGQRNYLLLLFYTFLFHRPYPWVHVAYRLEKMEETCLVDAKVQCIFYITHDISQIYTEIKLNFTMSNTEFGSPYIVLSAYMLKISSLSLPHRFPVWKCLCAFISPFATTI